MQEAGAIRAAALDAVEDVDPQVIYERIDELLDQESMAPGVFTIACANAVRERSGRTTDDLDADDALAERAAGVQLIYVGLSRTRALAADQPWTTGDGDAANLEILVADILVARGFYLLARTEASDEAVAVVRAFGRDQTVARETGESLDSNLERDVFELAAVAGATAAGVSPTPQLRELATDLGDAPSEASLPRSLHEQLTAVVSVDSSGTDGVRTSVDH
ncbi:DUF7114 family protein [Halapricum hydrolyticum]|uniref:Uncharacterized protein n=1 Tax=Halapricum hydrolyticum TaxID=2979991 RepID=A0AAE3LID8_9EURY|nr:hypothetical protein [Halapricum hydrolyticum]MCU4718893.1 hypothetical protein [Halapricum hydrolyticum]MCU4727829.1 hypothetical protein [Halapricum hydrolyticum]